MACRDYVRCAVHTNLVREINKVLTTCRRRGMLISKIDASRIVAQKSRANVMNRSQIIAFLRKQKMTVHSR